MASIKAKEVEALAAAGRRMYDGGLASGTTGAIGARLSGEIVAVTAAGTRLGFLGRGDILLMNGAGPVGQNGREPARETAIIRAVLAAQPEAGSVIRVSSPFTTALAHRGRKTIERSAGLLEDLGGVVFVPYYRPGTAGLAGAVSEVLRSNRIAIIEEQGAVVWGTDIQDAIDHAENLEAAARVIFILDGKEV